MTICIFAKNFVCFINHQLIISYFHADLMYVFTADYHGSWDKVTGHSSPIYPRHDEKMKELNVVSFCRNEDSKKDVFKFILTRGDNIISVFILLHE